MDPTPAKNTQKSIKVLDPLSKVIWKKLGTTTKNVLMYIHKGHNIVRVSSVVARDSAGQSRSTGQQNSKTIISTSVSGAMRMTPTAAPDVMLNIPPLRIYIRSGPWHASPISHNSAKT